MSDENAGPPDRTDGKRRRRRREFGVIIAVSLFIIALTITIVQLSSFSSEIPVHINILFFGLININVILILLLLFLVLRNLVKLFLERKRNVLGSKLRTKLVASFVIFSFVPSILMFFVAGFFVVRSIERWFSVQVKNSLEESLEVAQTYYQNSAHNAIYYARQISRSIQENKYLNEPNLEKLRDYIRRKQVEYNLGAVKVFSASLEELVFAINPEIPYHVFPPPDSSFMKEGLKGREVTKIESAGERGEGDIIGGIVPIRSTFNPSEVVGVLMVNYYVPKSLVHKIAVIADSFETYKKSEILKKQIKLSYLMPLLIITLLIIFSATWFGFFMAKGITVPIKRLADGTHEIANGNLDYRISGAADDEMGRLVDAFNQMTHDLKTSKEQIERVHSDLTETNVELEQRRRYMEIVLRNVAAGVISLDSGGTISTINKFAEGMFGISAERIIGSHYKDLLEGPYIELIEGLLKKLDQSSEGTADEEVNLTIGDRTLTLLVHATQLRDEDRNYVVGLVAVFDDLTELLKAQKTAAWREVARRIAHEIKNPLTPIRLSAQRLKKRYSRLVEDGDVFGECTDTIIKQVENLRILVDEFSNFARMPSANPTPNDLNKVIAETLVLYQEAHKGVHFDFQRDHRIPVFMIDADQIQRAIINLLDNAVAAVNGKGEIRIVTRFDDILKYSRVEILDNGHGIPTELKHRLFEPYFSTKKSGTGLGLTIVKTIITDHHGYIRVLDNKPSGTRFIIELPIQA
ncbi:PAS domain-containing sensor histidine kinase [Thermodesulfobacteriota bacterium]